MDLKKIRLAAVSAALVFAGCSAPAVNSALKRLHLVSARTYYVPAAQFKTAEFANPPAPDSGGQKADLAAILDWQARRTKADCKKAKRTAKAGYDFFWDANSPFPGPLPPEARDFFDRLASDLEDSVTNMKERYRRPRPFRAYPGQAEPCIKKAWGYSYPSGHASFSRVFANVLSDIVPARRAEFFAKADEIALDRVIGGVHFPTDIAAGKVFGDRFHAELLRSPGYLRDIERMKALLKPQ